MSGVQTPLTNFIPNIQSQAALICCLDYDFASLLVSLLQPCLFTVLTFRPFKKDNSYPITPLFEALQ